MIILIYQIFPHIEITHGYICGHVTLYSMAYEILSINISTYEVYLT